MIHLHWYAAAVLGALVFIAGLLAMALIKSEQTNQLSAQLLAAWNERDRLQLACDYQDKALREKDDEIVELKAEIVIATQGPNA